MTSKTPNKALRLTVLAGLASTTLVGFGSLSPAYADRCEPEELVLGPNSSPIDERDSPACTVLFAYVYPFICSPDGQAPPVGLLACPTSLSINPNYRPPLIPPYNPDTGRLTCNLVRFASPSTTCTFTSDPATGDTSFITSDGPFVVPGTPTLEQK